MVIHALAKWLPHSERRKFLTTIVVHATAGSSLSGALSALRTRELSYHYLIDKNGVVTKCVPTSKVAWHAGVSKGPQGEHVNAYSVGISLVNRNNGKDPYTQEQHDALYELCQELIAANPTIRYLTTHYWISPGRKTDPRGYPMDRLWRALFAKSGQLVLWNGGRPMI